MHLTRKFTMLNEVMNTNLDQMNTEPAMLVLLVLGATLLGWAELSAHKKGQ
jgi:hypothetical protein